MSVSNGLLNASQLRRALVEEEMRLTATEQTLIAVEAREQAAITRAEVAEMALVERDKVLAKAREALDEISRDCWNAGKNAIARSAERAHEALANIPPIITRDERQRLVAEWCAAAFGTDHAASITQRGIRLAEEAIEAAQAAGCDPVMVHKLVGHVYSKPAGTLTQELGGVGITLLALAHAAGESAEAEEIREYQRVTSKPLEYFRARNEAKNSAGFNVVAPEEPPADENGQCLNCANPPHHGPCRRKQL